MHITRRDFLKYMGASAVVLGLSRTQLAAVERALASAAGPAVLWLNGASCSGCSVSLLNAVNPTIDQVLLDTISLKYHPTLMAAAGELAVAAVTSVAASGGHILVVEGAIPTAAAGSFCTVWEEGGRPVPMTEAVTGLAASASHIVAVGSCSAFGGFPSACCDTASQGLGSFLGRQVVNLPGCPAHPDWIIGSLAALLSGSVPALDEYGRPLAFYRDQSIHSRCPRREAEEAHTFGQAGYCLEELGCKGKHTHADCDLRGWNNHENWCIGVNGLCIGCTEPDFPRFPFHVEGEEEDDDDDDLAAANVTCVSGPAPQTDPVPTPPTSGDQDQRIYLPFLRGNND